MPLPFNNLDDRTYADLLDEARALIPGLDPEWTDHNPSDPGITLVELFAWLTEMLLYRANRVTDANTRKFLKLLKDPSDPGAAQADLADDIRNTVLKLREVSRAITSADYEELALRSTADDADRADGIVKRAKCIPRRDLGAGTEDDRQTPRAAHVSVIVLPLSTIDAPQPSQELSQRVSAYLNRRRMLTTRLHVVGPVYVPVGVEAVIATRNDVLEPVSGDYLTEHWAEVPDTDLRKAVVQVLRRFLSPLPTDGRAAGWPFGRSVFVSDLYELLEGIPGIDYVSDIDLRSTCPPHVPRCVAVTPEWHEQGDLIGLPLAPHQLPLAVIDPNSFMFAAAFLPVQVAAEVSISSGFTPRDTRVAAKSAIKRVFMGAPGSVGIQREVSIDQLRGALRALPEVRRDRPVTIELHSDLARQTGGALPDGSFVRFQPDELPDLQTIVTVLP